MALPTRKIGSSLVPRPGLGCMGMSYAYTNKTQNDEENNKRVLKTAYENGCTFWDTAAVYGNNEEFLGRAIKDLGIPRQNLFIATKFGFVTHPDGSRGVDGSPEYIKRMMENSLKNLQTDYVDIFYQHRVDPKTPIEVTISAMEELRKAGKARYLGMSECNVETLRRANKVAKIDALQIEYSLWDTEIETNGILDVCKELDIAVIAYSPLGRGFLSGQLRSPADLPAGDFRASLPRFSEENFPKNLEIVDKINALAQKKGATPSQLALAWVEAQWDRIFTIPGTTSVERLEENLGSAKVELTSEDLKEIRTIINSLSTYGARYAPPMQAQIGR